MFKNIILSEIEIEFKLTKITTLFDDVNIEWAISVAIVINDLKRYFKK